MKSIIMAFAFAFIAMTSFSTLSYACATCGCMEGKAHGHAHQGEMKPCEMCVKGGMDKPCAKCAESEMKSKRVLIDDGSYSNVGSLKIQSGQSFKSKAYGNYND